VRIGDRERQPEARAINNLPIASIGTEHILDVLQPIWRQKPETASRVRGRIELVLAYAIAAGYYKSAITKGTSALALPNGADAIGIERSRWRSDV
jgi:hypothetical protein